MPDPSAMSQPLLSGEFRWDTMLVRLFKDDFAPPNSEGRASETDLMMAKTAALHARTQAADALLLQKLPDAQNALIRRKLFHERMHYWQLLFCPMIQWGFVTYLDRLFFEGARMGARIRYICSQGGDDRVGRTSEDIKLDEDSTRSHFSTAEISPKNILFHNPITEKTDMPFLLLKHYAGNRSALPAYGAMLGFPDSEETSLFPFTGPYLWEAAAHLSESLFAGEKPQRPQSAMTREEAVYFGAWEFWCRLHATRYESEADLYLGFLAAVDLALVSRLPNNKRDFEYNNEFENEMSSIPYRFGKIVYRAQGFRPLIRGESEAADAVADWQNAFCHYAGWPTPDLHIKKILYILTEILCGAAARHMEDTPEGRKIVTDFFEMEPGGDWALAELESVWSLLHQAHKSGGSPAFGQLALGSMLNACVYRLKHPGEVALPHLYADRLWRQFPLPIVVVQGQYYQDSPPHGGVADPDPMGEPYPLTTMELLHDIMSLVTLRPMRKGLSGCGFVEDKSDCFYTRAGLGCPQKGLTEEQFNIRRQVGLDDWCHWLMRTLVLRTAPSAALDRWLSVWRTEAARKK